MKTKHRHIRVQDATHRRLAYHSNRLGISMTAVLQLAVEALERHGLKPVHFQASMTEKHNSRTALPAYKSRLA